MAQHQHQAANSRGLNEVPKLHIRPAQLHELGELSALCLRSKAVWGYDEAFLDSCRNALTLSRDDLLTTDLAVAEASAGIAGVAQVLVDQREADLLNLFIDPDHQSAGVGRKLFNWACDTARAQGATSLIIDSDPNAVPFYQRMGARKIGLTPSASIPGRMLPMLELAL